MRNEPFAFERNSNGLGSWRLSNTKELVPVMFKASEICLSMDRDERECLAVRILQSTSHSVVGTTAGTAAAAVTAVAVTTRVAAEATGADATAAEVTAAEAVEAAAAEAAAAAVATVSTATMAATAAAAVASA